MKMRRHIFILSQQKPRSSPGVFVLLIFSVFFISFIFLAPKLTFMAKKIIKKAKFETSIALMEKDSIAFEIQTSLIRLAPECFPIEIRKIGSVSVQYQFCSEEAKQKENLPVTISDNFSVNQPLARRFNFWRRIYSTWGSDQYVLHLSEWPEVVLAAYDVSQAPKKFGPIAKEIMAKKVAKDQKILFAYLLKKMHTIRERPQDFSYSMQRIAEAMSHIKDENKYLKAANKIRLQKGQKDNIEKGLQIAPKYLPAIELAFHEVGIPVELSRIAFIESSFNPKAYSKVGASGAYQIMPETGRQFSLKINAEIDERNDPIKAGRAAAYILNENFKYTGSWPLAITAYNHGVGGIQKAIRATNSREIHTLIDSYESKSFGFASKNFYASFLGMLATLNEKSRFYTEIRAVSPGLRILTAAPKIRKGN